MRILMLHKQKKKGHKQTYCEYIAKAGCGFLKIFFFFVPRTLSYTALVSTCYNTFLLMNNKPLNGGDSFVGRGFSINRRNFQQSSHCYWIVAGHRLILSINETNFISICKCMCMYISIKTHLICLKHLKQL